MTAPAAPVSTTGTGPSTPATPTPSKVVTTATTGGSIVGVLLTIASLVAAWLGHGSTGLDATGAASGAVISGLALTALERHHSIIVKLIHAGQAVVGTVTNLMHSPAAQADLEQIGHDAKDLVENAFPQYKGHIEDAVTGAYSYVDKLTNERIKPLEDQVAHLADQFGGLGALQELLAKIAAAGSTQQPGTAPAASVPASSSAGPSQPAS